MNITRIAAAVTLAVVAGISMAGSSIAASSMMATKPASKAVTTKMAAAPNSLFCQISKTGSKATVQVVNKGTKDVAAGTAFAYTIVGPKKTTAESYKLAWALGPKKSINVTKPMPAANVTSCAPLAS